MGGPYNPLNITIIPDCNSATSSYPSWAVLENELGVTLPRDPINQQGGLAFHPGRYFNYLYYSRTAAQGARCP